MGELDDFDLESVAAGCKRSVFGRKRKPARPGRSAPGALAPLVALPLPSSTPVGDARPASATPPEECPGGICGNKRH